jgi:catechol 2,3-dioxygenase-like lactoylglutathione lyase family enzyme
MTLSIKRLGHVGITVPDVEATVDFYERIMGMQVSQREADAVYLRCNEAHHCLSVFPGPAKQLHHLGLELSTTTSLEEAAAHLRKHGVEVFEPPDREPGHGQAIRFHDADRNVLELYAGMNHVTAPLEPREIRVGKFGHITYLVRNLAQSMRFYTDVLGFRLSDQMEDQAAWVRCNQDHHGVAFLVSDVTGVHHYAYELSDWDALRRFCDNLWHNDGVVSWGLGRHGPGHNLFCYIGDQAGNIVELFAELDQIWDEETYQPLQWKNELRTLCVWGGVPPYPHYMRGDPSVPEG